MNLTLFGAEDRTQGFVYAFHLCVSPLPLSYITSLVFWSSVSLCGTGWHAIHEPPASTSHMLLYTVCTTPGRRVCDLGWRKGLSLFRQHQQTCKCTNALCSLGMDVAHASSDYSHWLHQVTFSFLEQRASCAVYDRTTALNNRNSQTCHPDFTWLTNPANLLPTSYGHLTQHVLYF